MSIGGATALDTGNIFKTINPWPGADVGMYSIGIRALSNIRHQERVYLYLLNRFYMACSAIIDPK